MKLFLLIINLALFSIGLVACAGAETPAAVIPSLPAEDVNLTTEATEEPTATLTPAPTSTSTPKPEPTATNTLVPTLTPTSRPSPTPQPIVKIDETLTTKVNVRSGPDTGYPVVMQLDGGQEILVTGRNEASNWWQVDLTKIEASTEKVGWIFGELVVFRGDNAGIPVVEAPPLPTPTANAVDNESQATANNDSGVQPETPEDLANRLRCGKDFCVTYQAMVPIWENGGCVGNHSIYITVLKGLPPGEPMDGVVIGDTYNNVEVASGSHGPGHTEITLWSNSMTLIAKRHIDETPYTSEESFNFTAHDELIPADVLASAGYCGSDVEQCRQAQQHNQVCRGHYSWRVTFHKFD